MYCNLRRHITKAHGDEEEVMTALSFDKASKERDTAFDRLRKKGIFQYNKNQAGLDVPVYLSERSGHADVWCSKCKAFYDSKLFYRHKERCLGDDITTPRRVKVDVLRQGDGDFENEILSRFHQDEIGKLCRTDSSIIFIGKMQYQKGRGKVGKEMEVRKSVMNNMRLLAKLYISFKDILPISKTFEDMFQNKHFDILEQAIDNITRPDGGLKHGVKRDLQYLLENTQEMLIGMYAQREEDDKVASIERFVKVFNLKKSIIFADATYAINFNRQERLRMPEQQADEVEVEKLRQHIKNKINNLCSPYTLIGRHEYIELRDSLCSRLTLFNARRGGEPSRLKISHFTDALAGRWIDSQLVEQLEDWEKRLFSDMLAAYQPGKGSHLVPVLIPQDCVIGLQLLCNPEIRERATILHSNECLFPNTSLSADHVIGWACINKMGLEANVRKPEHLTASKQRHRISTIYASFEVPETEREFFYSHMGHSKSVNVGTYQYPLPIQEVIKVGRHLQAIDSG